MTNPITPGARERAHELAWKVGSPCPTGTGRAESPVPHGPACNDLAAALTDADQREAGLRAEIASVREYVPRLEAERDALRADLDSATVLYATAKGEVERLRSTELPDLCAREAVASVLAEEATAQAGRLRAETTRLQSLVDTLTAEVERLTTHERASANRTAELFGRADRAEGEAQHYLECFHGQLAVVDALRSQVEEGRRLLESFDPLVWGDWNRGWKCLHCNAQETQPGPDGHVHRDSVKHRKDCPVVTFTVYLASRSPGAPAGPLKVVTLKPPGRCHSAAPSSAQRLRGRVGSNPATRKP